MHLWLVENEYPYVTPVQITNSMDSLSKLGLSYLGNVFSCALLTSDDMISLAIWCNMHLKLSYTTNCTCPMGLCNFVVFEEFTCACLFTWIYLTNIKHQSWYKDTFFAVHLSEVHLHPSGMGRQGDRDKLSRHSHVKYCIFSNKCLYSTCNKHLPTNKHPTPRP